MKEDDPGGAEDPGGFPLLPLPLPREALPRELPVVGPGVSARDEDEGHLAPRACPFCDRPGDGELDVVGVGVDRHRGAGHVPGVEPGHGEFLSL